MIDWTVGIESEREHCLTYSADNQRNEVCSSIGEHKSKMNDCQNGEYSDEGISR